MRAVRSSTVVHYRHADRLSPSNFNWLVRAREWSWQQDITTTKGASLAAVAALLFGGELAVDDAIDTLKRVSLADVVIERDTVWLFIQPAGCSAAYPIALRADTAIWLLHYLLQWVQEQDARPGSRLFGDVSDESIVGLATSLLGVRDLTLADLVSGNRAYLRTIYPADSVAYLAAHWRKLKLACCGPHGAGRRRRYRAGSNPDVAIGRQLRAALRDLTHDQPGARPSTPLVERYLLQRADAWLKDYGQAGCGVARLPLLRAARDVVRADGDESSCNVLLGLLIGAELVRTKSHLSTRSVETYLGRLESWIGQAGDVPLWQTADILDHEHPARRSVILSAANRVFEALDVARLRVARESDTGSGKAVTYVDLPLFSVEEWLARIDRLHEPEDTRRSLQLQFILACEVRSAALYSLTFGEVLPKSGEVILRWEKFGHPGVRTLPRVMSPVWAELQGWLANHRRRHPAAPITSPTGSQECRLGQWLPRLGFGKANSIHDVRALWCSLQYLLGYPLVGQAELMAHRRPTTTLESYVLTRHLRQRDLAAAASVTPLPARLAAQLNGFSVGYALGEPGVPHIRGLERLPLACFRQLSLWDGGIGPEALS
ncbi:MAG TPA: hypothetical protein VIR57_11355, partial [Chloroflexota bacterium]